MLEMQIRLFEHFYHIGHLLNGVQSFMRCAAMSTFASYMNIKRGIPFVRRKDSKISRFPNQRHRWQRIVAKDLWQNIEQPCGTLPRNLLVASKNVDQWSL